jgi:hypothetical protein
MERLSSRHLIVDAEALLRAHDALVTVVTHCPRCDKLPKF